MGRTIWDDIRNDDTFKQITRTSGGLINNSLSNLSNFSNFGKKFIETTTSFFSGDGLYLIIAVGGGFVVIYGINTLTRK